MRLNPRLVNVARFTQSTLLHSIGLGLMSGIIGVFQARQLSKVINQVFLLHHSLDSETIYLIIIFVIILLRAGFTWASEVSANAAARRITQDFRRRLFSHLMDLGPAFLRDAPGNHTRTGELVTLATEGMDALEIYFSQYIPQIALAALIPLAILVFVFPSDLLSGVILLLTAPLLPLFMVLIGNAAESLTRQQWQGLSRMSAYFLDMIEGLTTLKILGRSKEQIEIIRKVSERYRQSTMSVLKVTFLSALVLELITTLSTAVVAVEIGLRLLYGKLAFEQAFLLLLLAPEFYQPLRLLGTRFHAGMAGVEAASSLFKTLDIQTKSSPISTEKLREPGSWKSAPSISIKDLGFAYPDQAPLFQGISCDIPAGKITALCGKSGAGKTSLTWLLLGFLHAQSGQILVNGKTIDEITHSEWLQNLSWVPQNPFLFNDTIQANIKLANPQADDVAIIAAAQQAHADEFIQGLPLGYQTQIGERGMRLSAGQAQRIALARAFLKDAPFLILDEATAHLDPETDSMIRASLQRLSVGRTVLVIAHHQKTLDLADQVITLADGKIDNIHMGSTTQPFMQLPIQHDTSLPAHPVPLRTTQDTPKIKKDHYSEDKKVSTAGWLIRLLSPFTGRILLSVMLGFATICSSVGLMATAAYLISAAALHPSIADLQVAIVGVRFFGLSRGVFRYLERLTSHDMTFRLLASLRTRFYQALEPLAPGRLLRYHSGDLLTRVTSDIASLENFYVRSISPPLVALLVVVAITFFVGSFGAELAGVLLIFLLIAGVGLPAVSLIASRRLGPGIIAGRAGLNTLLVDGLHGMADLFTCGQASAYLARVRGAGAKLSQLQSRMSLLTASQSATGNLLASLGMLVVLTIAIQKVTVGQLDGVLLGVVTLTAFTCFEALLPLPQAAQNFYSNQMATQRLRELVETPAEVNDPSKPLPLPSDSNLEMQRLSFQYPPWLDLEPSPMSSEFTLQDITFSISIGKHLAIVGPSGAGKSTLVQLILRFWEYEHGEIIFGHNDLRRYCPDDLREHLAVIPQSTYLFSATIKDNLLIAKPDATQAELIEATRLAQLQDMIVSLPNGYETWIGEHGLRLSMGERQRMAIARAFLKNAPIVILDEATVNLDTSTELAIQDSIRSISRGRSVITITQSMRGLEEMDEILVLRDGRVIERGRHEELIALHGLYYRMWRLDQQRL